MLPTTEMEVLSFWWNFYHWLHWKLSFDNFQCIWKFCQNAISVSIIVALCIRIMMTWPFYPKYFQMKPYSLPRWLGYECLLWAQSLFATIIKSKQYVVLCYNWPYHNKPWLYVVWITFSEGGLIGNEFYCGYIHDLKMLTNLSLDKMAAISQTIFSDVFSWMKSFRKVFMYRLWFTSLIWTTWTSLCCSRKAIKLNHSLTHSVHSFGSVACKCGTGSLTFDNVLP